MERDSDPVGDSGENSGRPTREPDGAADDAGAPRHDLESAAAPNEDWGLETLPDKPKD